MPLPSPSLLTSTLDAGLTAVAALRLAEIETLKEEAISLQKQNNELTLKMTNIPETVLLQHPAVEHLRRDLSYSQGEATHWKGQNDKVFAQLQETREEHRRYLEQLAVCAHAYATSALHP